MVKKGLRTRIEIEREEARAAFLRIFAEAGDTRSEAEIIADAKRANYYTPAEAETIIRELRRETGPIPTESSDGRLVFVPVEDMIADVRRRTRG